MIYIVDPVADIASTIPANTVELQMPKPLDDQGELRAAWQHLVFNMLGGSDLSYTLDPINTIELRKKIAEQFFPELEALLARREAEATNKARMGMIEYLDQAPTNDSCSWKGLLSDCRKMVENDIAALNQHTPKEKTNE